MDDFSFFSLDGPSLIPEHKRRKKDLDEVNKTDPLRSLVFRCLDNAPHVRPSAAEVTSELQGHKSTLPKRVVELDCEDNIVFERIFSLEQKHFDYEFKLLFIGDFGVGKSCLMRRYRNPAYDIMMSTSTIGVDLDREIFRYGSNYVRAQIVDTGGQEQFFSVSPMYFRDVHGVFLVCDVTREHTFVSMRRWIDVAAQYCRDTVAVLAVGNKIDLVKERKVSYEKAKEFTDTFQLPYIETSAQDVDSIQEMYHKLIQMLVKMVDLGDIKIKDSSKEEKVILAPAEPARSKCICRKS